ncbi:hypothetical protein PX52LOC_01839 [Limnoglobus roseus]|uniref:Uncharacterized protein n=2 Tax=Limnoglobus roseus TaxID=2598579 RepID=A0A5C1AD06_9BACT|nr:hypothetical protein PX52LOC_01839 [Limnoglobus roseus]
MTDAKPTVRPLPYHVCVLVAVTGIWFFLCLPHVTNAGAGLQWGCLLLPLTVVMVASWFRCLVQLADAEKRDRRVVKLWCGCTALGLVIALFTFTPVGLTARVWLSSGSLQQLAGDLLPAGEETPTVDRIAGLFLVEKYETSNDGAVAFYTCESGMCNRAGVLYLPPGTTPPSSVRVEEHLYGPWYRFWWKW